MALTKINASVIANNTIAVGNIADNSVDATKIASNSILTRHIDDNQIGIDQINVSDGSNGQFLKTNGSGTLSFATVSTGVALDDVSTGDAATTLATSAGNITIDAQGSDTDIIFKGTDGSTDTTFLTLDGSAAGFATFNDGITLKNGMYINNADGSATSGYLYNDSDDFVIRSYTQDKDIIFKGNDGGSVITPMTIDMSAGGNVGLGTTSPAAKLEIYGDTTTWAGMSKIYLTDVNSNTSSRNWSIGNGGTAFGSLSFITSNAADGVPADSSGTAVMSMDGVNKRVGIGTASPGAVLEVSGKDDAGISDLLRLQFDNSPADTGITMTDINSTIKNRITMDSANTNDLRISAGTQIHLYGGTSNGTGAGHLTVKSSGVINMPLQAIMVRTLASGQTIGNSSTTTINWDTNETTTDITYSSGEFTIVTAGVYLINTYARFQSAATGHNQFLSLHHRASGGSFVEIAYDYVLSCRGYHQMNINRAKECAAGDVMKVVVWQTSGGNLDLTGNSSSCAISVTKVV